MILNDKKALFHILCLKWSSVYLKIASFAAHPEAIYSSSIFINIHQQFLIHHPNSQYFIAISVQIWGVSMNWYCIKSWYKVTVIAEIKPRGRRDWALAKMLPTSLLPLPPSQSGKLLQPFLVIIYLALNHTSQASIVAKPGSRKHTTVPGFWNGTEHALPPFLQLTELLQTCKICHKTQHKT